MKIPRRVSRVWGACELMTDAEVEWVDGWRLLVPGAVARLQRRDDPTQVVIVPIPEWALEDVSVDLWAIVRKRATAEWRRVRRAQRGGVT